MMPSKPAVKLSAKFADLSEQILHGMMTGESPTVETPIRSKSQGINIKNVKVPESMVESILGFATGKEPEPEVESIDEAVVIENKISDLVKRLNSLLVEAKQVLSEMCGGMGTTTGMIGTNQKFVLGRKTGSPKGKKKKP